LINDIEKIKKLSESDEAIAIHRRIYAISEGEADEKIAIDNLAELSVNAYEAGLVTFEKLEYLLGLCGLKPVDLGIFKNSVNTFPSDNELDEIMEEDE
jgi:hypothetical protein